LKTRIASLSLLALCLTLAAIPAMAQNDIYDNGGTTGTADAWTVNFGFAVSDSFVPTGSSANGASFIFWLSPGDTAPTVDLSIGTSAFGSDVANFTGLASTGSTNLGSNQFGFTLEQDSYSFSSTALTAGNTYWVTLQNAAVPSGDPVYWDENSGPSQAQENSLGTIPSESFTILGGGGGTTTTTTTSTGNTPEPSSIMLFGSGILGLAGVLRRKLF
jgi:hypothetical protein